MRREAWAVIYGFWMMTLMLIVNLLLAEIVFPDIDISILFFCDIIALLSMIWHFITTRDNK